jgi:hypothetical protein
MVLPLPAHAFAGIPGSGCADLVGTPQKFFRHRDDDITYRISQNFKVRYPDAFSQYLVRDVARWWQDYISGFVWKDDINDRFSYYRKDNNLPVYELKSVLTHEFGHAMGMQHSDACFYNINSNTGQPWKANYRTTGGGNVAVQPTIGPELMNEIWTVSSPGEKAPKSLGIDGYNRTPGRDDFEFMNYAYPFQSLSLEEINSGNPDILVDTTDTNADSTGGQTSYPGGVTNIVPGDDDQGWFMDGVNIWVGNNIGLKSRIESWFIKNNAGFNITQLTLRVNGTSTRRAISESAPPFFTNFGVGLTSSPEQLVFSWNTPFNGPWPSGAEGWLSLQLDVHDWTLQEALMWADSNNVFPLALPFIQPIKPWGLVSPNAPSPGMEPAYSLASNVRSEPTPEPNEIELLPPRSIPEHGSLRAFKLVVPQVENIQIESFELLPLDWSEAEILVRQTNEARNELLMREFDQKRTEVVNLIDQYPSQEMKETNAITLEELGLKPDTALFAQPRNDTQQNLPPLSRLTRVAVDDQHTYAVRTVLSTPAARVTAISLPEMDTYLGTRMARCSISNDAASCCPYEMKRPLEIKTEYWSAKPLNQSRCIIGSDRNEKIELDGDSPHLLASGDGNDFVSANKASSIVLLGNGGDYFKANDNAKSHVYGGAGKDRILGSDLADYINGGSDADILLSGDGDDIVYGMGGDDFVNAGSGNDEIYPGSGENTIFAGDGDDRVVYTNLCELDRSSLLVGGPGNDTLVLPTSAVKAHDEGLDYYDFERIVEDAKRDSEFANCE